MAFFVFLIFTSLVYGSSLADATNCLNVVCGNSLEHCVNNGTHDRCECLSAYYRPSGSGLCHRDCEKSYCYHGGKCERGPNGRVCRCVSPYSGVRCENERQISIQIAVGSSIMAVVLVVSLCLIVKNNIKNSEKKKEKHGWDLDLEEAMSNEAENEELPQVTGEPVVEECNQQELKEGKDNDDIAESTAHHTAEVRTEAANGSPPRYETVVEINNRPSKCSDSPDEIKVENEIDTKAGHADAPQAYANAAAEASVEEEEKGAEESAL